MKISKLLVLGATIGALFSVPSLHAQAEGKGKGKGGQMTAEARVDRLDQAVTLTADQKTKITALYKAQMEKLQAIPQEERREKGQALMQETQKAVRALLTAEQQAKFDAMPQMGRGGPGGGKKQQ